MTFPDRPSYEDFAAFGPSDRRYRALLAVGPLLGVLLVLVGRTVATELLAAGYVLALLVTVVARTVEAGGD